MSGSVSFGLSIPPALCGFGAGGGASPQEWLEHLEVPGIDSLWSLDQLSGRSATPEPISLLSYVAALTTRVRLGIAVLVGPSRGPVAAAKALTTLDWLSNGRLDVGLGLGDLSHYGAFGLDRSASPAGAMLDEFTTMIQQLWAEDMVDHDGASWHLHGIGSNPKPTQDPHPPLWFGGGGQASLRRAVERGSGWIGAGRHSNVEFVELAGRLRRLLDEQPGRSVGFTVSKRVYILVTDDVVAGADTVRAWFGSFYGRPELGASVTVMGSPNACVAQLGMLIEAGANHLVLHPLDETLAQFDRLINSVVPQLS